MHDNPIGLGIWAAIERSFLILKALAFLGENRYYLWKTGSEYAIVRNRTAACQVVRLDETSNEMSTHIVKPVSTNASISSGTSFPLSSCVPSIFAAHSIRAVLMKSVLLAR